MVGSWLSEHHAGTGGTTEARGLALAADRRSNSRLLSLYLKIKALQHSSHEAGFEISLRGAWPRKEYHSLLSAEIQILESLSQIAACIAHSDPEWRALVSFERLAYNFQNH
ncbi:hypothetical protein RQP46_000636 [Phenoliferia psychrophenolica]